VIQSRVGDVEVVELTPDGGKKSTLTQEDTTQRMIGVLSTFLVLNVEKTSTMVLDLCNT
jgi:hypothetical protein